MAILPLARPVGDAAEIAASSKEHEITSIPAECVFQPVVLETLGSGNSAGSDFLGELGRRLIAASGEVGEASFRFQRLSLLLQHFNSVTIHELFAELDP